MLLDLGVTSSMPSTEFTEVLNLADKLGFHCLWIGEDLDKPHDVFVKVAFALMKTTLSVGTAIASISIRNISNIARAAATLHEIDNGRFRLGIGIGGLSTIKKMGIHLRKPLSAMREATLLLRRIWSGEVLTFKSESFHFKEHRANYGLGQKIPIYFGVRGVKMLELAGEVADGVILSGPKTYLKKVIEIVREGARKASRSERDINLAVWLPTVLTRRKKDSRLAKRVAAIVLADTPDNILKFSKIDLETARAIRKVFMQERIDVADRLLTDEILEEMMFCGCPRELCESFLSLEGYNVNEVVFGPPFGVDRDDAITQVAKAWRRVH